jgi:putative flavoprotein involved in K+ transport
MQRIDAVIIGGGQAGLAMSACLSARNVAHVVLERRRVAARWLNERWDSLRLLTPNWMNRLPGWSYDGADPDGFMAAADVANFLGAYARRMAIPVVANASVDAVTPATGGYSVRSSAGNWQARAVVVATGQCDVPYLPGMARCLNSAIAQIHASQYRNPSGIPGGRILIVGASSSGLQIAHELNAAGRAVTLAVGRHIRMPRRYLGHDIMWWLDRAGILDEPTGAIHDLDRSRRQPSLQLSGHPDQSDLNLAVLQHNGVELAGRLVAVEGNRVRFGSDLASTVAAAEAKLNALLARVNRRAGLEGARNSPVSVDVSTLADEIDLGSQGFSAVIWATGYRRNYQWLQVPVIDSWGELIHQEGITPAPGLYVIGLNLLRRRNSSFIGGVGRDAFELAQHLAGHLNLANLKDGSPGIAGRRCQTLPNANALAVPA